MTEDEYRQRLVRDGWPADEVENLVEDFKPGGVSFVVHEFAELADGRRLTLHEERGFTMASGGPAPSDLWRYLTLENLERDVRTTVLPDDDVTQDVHPWEWLAGLLHVHGVEATAVMSKDGRLSLNVWVRKGSCQGHGPRPPGAVDSGLRGVCP